MDEQTIGPSRLCLLAALAALTLSLISCGQSTPPSLQDAARAWIKQHATALKTTDPTAHIG